MAHFRAAIVVVCVSFFAIPAHAQLQTIEGTAEIDQAPSQTALGAAIFRALTNDAPPSTADPLYVIAYVPPNLENNPLVCIQLHSSGSQYNGRYRYPRPDTPGWYRFHFPTRHESDVRKLGVAHLSPLAYTSRQCSDEGDQDVYLPALFGSAHTSAVRLRVLATNADEVAVAIAPRGGTFPCSGPGEEFSYTHECSVNLGLDNGSMELVVQTRRGRSIISDRMKVWRAP